MPYFLHSINLHQEMTYQKNVFPTWVQNGDFPVSSITPLISAITFELNLSLFRAINKKRLKDKNRPTPFFRYSGL